MKHSLILTLSLLAAAAVDAVSFDTQGFGQRLNGWGDDRTAVYSLTDGVYRTHIPTITGTPGGGMFLSTQVDFGPSGGSDATCHLDLTFSATGVLEGAQVKALVEGRNLDTGLVRRAQPQPVAPAAEDGEGAAPAVPVSPGKLTDEMIAELFERFDAEFKKITGDKDKRRRDLFSRIGRNTPRAADIAAGLRHNINLILQHVNRHGSSKQIVAPAPGTSQPRTSWWRGGGGDKRKGHPAR